MGVKMSGLRPLFLRKGPLGLNSTMCDGIMKNTSKREAARANITTLGRSSRYLPITPPIMMRMGKKAAMVVVTEASTGPRTSRLPSRVAWIRGFPISLLR